MPLSIGEQITRDAWAAYDHWLTNVYNDELELDPLQKVEAYARWAEEQAKEREYCPLCDCHNGHSLSCVTIQKDAIEHQKYVK